MISPRLTRNSSAIPIGRHISMVPRPINPSDCIEQVIWQGTLRMGGFVTWEGSTIRSKFGEYGLN
jgi:hypothetical protein